MQPQQFDKITTAGVKRLITAALDTGENGWVGDLAMRIASDQALETYAWLGNSPALVEFVGGRKAVEIKENSFSIRNLDYEASIRIQSKDLRRDKIGGLSMRVDQLATRVLDHPAALLSRLINAGAATPCYDGEYFFDTDHPSGSGTASNAIGAAAAVPAKPTADEFGEAVIGAIQTMMTFQDDRGEPINQSARNFAVMVPVPYLGASLKAVTALLGSGGQSATLPALSGYFQVRVIPNPRLTWTTKFATFRTDEAAKPFILQEENQRVIGLGEGSEYEEEHAECLFGVDWSGNVAPAWWQHACLTTFATP